MTMELDNVESFTDAATTKSSPGCWQASLHGADVLALGLLPSLASNDFLHDPFPELLEEGFPFASPEAARKPAKDDDEDEEDEDEEDGDEDEDEEEEEEADEDADEEDEDEDEEDEDEFDDDLDED